MTDAEPVYDSDTDWAEHWEPDVQLVPAVLAASRPISTLTAKQDRCWLVAGLKVYGLTAEDMADRLKCSLRLVRTLMAEPMTLVCRMYLAEADAFAEELHLVRHELAVRTRHLDLERAEHGRVREQRDRMLDALVTGEPISVCRRGGHLMDKYNTYTHPKTGKRSCRKCRYDALRRHRGQDEITGVTSSSAAAHGAPSGLAGVPTAAPTADGRSLGDHGPAAPASVAPGGDGSGTAGTGQREPALTPPTSPI